MEPRDWFQVDVISCAAPYIANRKYTNKKALKELLKTRIKNIFEAAMDNDVDVLILGAWGCGAFKNPPEVVASAFHEVIVENGYKNCFKHIVFAIKSVKQEFVDASSNLDVFEREFAENASLTNNILFREMVSKTQSCGGIVMPSGRVLKEENELLAYFTWKKNNKYAGKQFSILGDSISTLDGYNPKGYNLFYTNENCQKTGVYNMRDTWWGKVIDFFDGELLVNNSWSGSRVTKHPSRDTLFPSGCSDERTSNLHINNVKPDVIIVNLGVNDWTYGADTDGTIILDGLRNYEKFDYAYGEMLHKLKKNYPKCEIWCCTLNESYMASNANFQFPYMYGGYHIEEYNDIIRFYTERFNCNLIDFAQFHIPHDTIDGSHPTALGMNMLAMMMIRVLDSNGAKEFLDCENKQHTYVLSKDGLHHRCTKCGKEKEETIHKFNMDEYVNFDPEKTGPLYTDTLKLTMESTGKNIEIQKKEINMGRDLDCEFVFHSKYYDISPKHVTFFFEFDNWFVRDNDSEHGTWINGEKLFPHKKYQLCAGDVIDLAHIERVKFYEMESYKNLEKKKLIQEEPVRETKKQPVKKVGDEWINTLAGGRYRVLHKIVEYGYSKLYKVLDERTNQIYAMKIGQKNDFNNAIILREIMNETNLLIKLNHPAIPKIVDIVEENANVFIIREYVEGITLDSVVKMQGVQSPEKVMDWAKQLCYILQYLHTLTPPHIHRDIKPLNIILMPNGQLKLIDFGIMRMYKPGKKQDTTILGTLGYAPPEQFGSMGQTDARSDIYALGKTLLYFVTGVSPKEFKGDMRSKNPKITWRLEEIIRTCTNVNPEKRYQNCEELLRALNGGHEKKKGLLGKIFG